MKMSSAVIKRSARAAGVATLFWGFACAQEYPFAHPLRILTSQAGSGSDLIARIMAERLPQILGQHAIVDNRGILAPEIAANASADGYTLVYYSTPLWVAPLMEAKARWDAKKDFAAVMLAANAPNVLAVHPSLPVKSVRDLIALAKAKPGALNYGSGSAGSTSHLAAELFNSGAGVRITRVPYRGVGQALIALLGGQMQVLFPSAGSATPYIKSGRLRPLAVTSPKPTPLLPDLPTIAASGVPGYEADTPLGIFVPARTPPEIIDRLSSALAAVLRMPEVRKLVFAQGADIAASSPAEFSAWLSADIARWEKLIREKGLRETVQ